ncbi:hypothetical protein BS78_04G026900 [Paspalum vaginatum]|nr:hypothetical protein BS78_04G026900 [Paspalum vaginatum]
MAAASAAFSLLLQLAASAAALPMKDGGGARYKDPKQPLNTRIDDLLGRMTLAEKIGQMSQIERENATADVVNKYFVGVGEHGERAGMQLGALSTRLGIPIIYGIDAVHGHGNVYKATIFPHNISDARGMDPELAQKIGAAVALEVRATGIPYVFAPCVAVCRDPRWGRCYESFSEHPEVVRNMTSIISGFQGEIPANGRRPGAPYVAGQRNDNTVATFHELMNIHLPPYYNAVIRGVSTVMVSFSSWNGVKMHANHFLVTDLLKNRLRFRGFIISDWQGIDRITTPAHADYLLSIKLGILAGIDMAMIPYTYTEFIDDLTLLVQNGTIPMSHIDDAVRRILPRQLGKQEHRDLAREAVCKSLVLLKNGKPGDKPLLPLPKKAGSILVAGGHADDLGSQCGGWTITWQGLTGNNLTSGTTILDGIKRAVDPATDVVYSENPDAGFVQQNKARFDYAVLVVGEPPYAETFGDNLNLTIPAPGPDVIQNVCGSIRCVVVLVSGRPLVVEPYGVADVLFGDYGFTGKLSRTWFRSVEQLPMNVGDAHYDPLFPFGFGLETQPSTY